MLRSSFMAAAKASSTGRAGRGGRRTTGRQAASATLSGIDKASPAFDGALGVFEALLGEVGVGAVVGLDELEADGRGLVALGQEVAGGEEVALALGHLVALDHEESRVEPHAGEGAVRGIGAERAGGLRDLALVVREDVVFTAGVQIDDRGLAGVVGEELLELRPPPSPSRRRALMTVHSMCQPGYPAASMPPPQPGLGHFMMWVASSFQSRKSAGCFFSCWWPSLTRPPAPDREGVERVAARACRSFRTSEHRSRRRGGRAHRRRRRGRGR